MTESKFKAGDRVRLTGENWDPHDGVPARGEIVEITRIDATGTPRFQAEGEDWYLYDSGYEAELVTEAEQLGVNADEIEDFSENVKKFASGGYVIGGGVTEATSAASLLATVLVKKDSLTEEQLDSGGWVTIPAVGDAINPGHYQFPGGVEVRQISAHLTSFGGQAVQYIARSTRLDGRNKGDQIENLKKALVIIGWEIDRIAGT